MEPSYKKYLKLWAILSLILFGLYIASLSMQTGTTFFLLLNGLNAASIITVLLFKKQITTSLKSLKETYQSIQHKSYSNRIITSYSNESTVGLLLVSIAIFIGLYIITLSIWDTQGYRILIMEDGIVENSSSFFWLLAALTLLFSVIRAKLNGKIYNLWLLPNILLIAFFIVCGGEEISWGQRIFHLSTPDFLKAVNVQNELTLHNIGSISVFSNAFFLLTLVYFWGIPFARAKNKNFRKFTDFYALPIPNKYTVIVYSISIGIWLFIGTRFGTLGFHPFSFYAENYYTQMDDEIFEFLAAYSFFCFSVMNSLKETKLEKVS